MPKFNTPFKDVLPPLTTEEFDALKADIKKNGVKHPIVVDQDGNIIDGHHRYRIDKNAPVIIVDIPEEERPAATIRFNMQRRNLSHEQKQEVREQQKKIAGELREAGYSQKAIAGVLGVSREWVREYGNITNGTNANSYKPEHDCRVKIPKEARESIFARVEAGETQSQIAADFGVTQPAVSTIVRKVKKQREAAETIDHDQPEELFDQIITDEESLYGRNFGCVYADPPWKYGNQGTRGSTDNHYPTMTVREICEMGVEEMVADNAQLHLWTTNAFLKDAFEVITSWGFEYRSCFVWVKPQMGMGNTWRVSHEFLLLGTRGNSKTFPEKNHRSWGEFPRRKHSEKPDEVREIIERVSPGPRLELFGRKQVEGWTVFGNQIERMLVP